MEFKMIPANWLVLSSLHRNLVKWDITHRVIIHLLGIQAVEPVPLIKEVRWSILYYSQTHERTGTGE